MYTMLGGETPFDVTENDTPEVVLKKLNSNKIKLSGGNWDYVSEQAKDLLKQMLNFDSSKRPTAKQGKYLKKKIQHFYHDTKSEFIVQFYATIGLKT